MKISELEETCSGFPSQWEFLTDGDHLVYVRYRWGVLSVEVMPGTYLGIDSSLEIVHRRIGGVYDGVIDWAQVEAILAPLDVQEEILRAVKALGDHRRRMAEDPLFRNSHYAESVEAGRRKLREMLDRQKAQGDVKDGPPADADHRL